MNETQSNITTVTASGQLLRTMVLSAIAASVLLCFASEALAAQATGNGVKRIFAPENSLIDIDGTDDKRVDVDVAILDSGIDLNHPDLNVVSGVDCTEAKAPSYMCDSSDPGDGDDSHGHGTGAAGTIGAIDNDFGVVGVAPGARLWAVDVLGDEVFQHAPPIGDMDALIAGVKWVTATRTDGDPDNDIEVALVVPCSPLAEPPVPAAKCPSADEGKAYEDAVSESIDEGVVYVTGATTAASKANKAVPFSDPLMIGGSAMSDFDGEPGAQASTPSCQGVEYPEQTEKDDSLSDNTLSQGAHADIATPGYCIATTLLNGEYGYGFPGSAPSSAIPHVAGAAALLASRSQPDSRADVGAIRATVMHYGNHEWVDDSGDGNHEPLLDVGCEVAFAPKMVGSAAPGIGNPDAESDVDCDGHADLVTLSANDLGYVFPGKADRTFGAGVESFKVEGNGFLDTALFDGNGFQVIDVADVTGDRRADFVTLHSNGTVYLAPAKTTGEFRLDAVGVSFEGSLTPALLDSGGHEPIAVADVDGDGHGDLIAYHDVSDELIVYAGNSDGTFDDPGTVADSDVLSALHTPGGEYFVDAADVTGDDRADLVSMDTTADSLLVRAGQANGTFAAPVASHGSSIDNALDDANGFEPVGLGDVTGEGRADLVLHESSSGTLKTYAGNANGTLSSAVNSFSLASLTFGKAEGAEFASVIDVDGDGHADLVGPASNGNVYVVPGTEAGSFNIAALATSFKGSFKSTQHGKNTGIGGQELVTEKPAMRRRGCLASGCTSYNPDFPQGDYDHENWRVAEVISPGSGGPHGSGPLCGSGVSCEFDDFSGWWQWRLDTSPGKTLQTTNCSGGFEGEIAGDGGIEVTGASWTSSEPGSFCQGSSGQWKLGAFPWQGQVCVYDEDGEGGTEGEAWARFPMTVTHLGNEIGLTGETFGRLTWMTPELTPTIEFGNSSKSSLTRVGFPSGGYEWNHGGWHMIDEVEVWGTEEPCAWPELAP